MIKSILLRLAGGIVGASMAGTVLAAPPPAVVQPTVAAHPVSMAVTIVEASRTEAQISAHVAALDREIQQLRAQMAILQAASQNTVQIVSPNEQNIPRGD